MSAHSLPLNLHKAFENKFFHVDDPGASGVITMDGKGHAICEVVTAGAESRVLPAVGGVEPGMRLLVVLKTDGGDLSITGGEDGTSVLTTVGDIVEFVVVNKNGTKVWKNTIFDADLDTVEANVASLEAYAERAHVVNIPYTDFRVFDAQTTVLPVHADDDSDDIQIGVATIGTSAPTFAIGVTNATVTKNAIVNAVVPDDYVAGSALSIVVPWTRTDAATTSSSLDLVAYRHAAPTVDICATAAQSINGAASGTATFVLTPTNIVPGETILLHFTVAVVDGTTSRQDLTSISWSFTPAVIS